MAKDNLLKYKGKPLLRKGNDIYYGNFSDNYIVLLKVLSKKTLGKEEVPDKISVQLLSTDEKLSAAKRVIKTSEKNGLYNAMDIGAVWLERALRGTI